MLNLVYQLPISIKMNTINAGGQDTCFQKQANQSSSLQKLYKRSNGAQHIENGPHSASEHVTRIPVNQITSPVPTTLPSDYQVTVNGVYFSSQWSGRDGLLNADRNKRFKNSGIRTPKKQVITLTSCLQYSTRRTDKQQIVYSTNDVKHRSEKRLANN